MKILRMRELVAKTGLARSTIYLKVKQGTFPRPIKLGVSAAGWLEDEVDEWIHARITERGAPQSVEELATWVEARHRP